MDAFQLSALNWQITGVGRAPTEHNGIVLCQETVGGNVLAHFAIRDEGHAFGAHQIDPLLDPLLFELHVGDAVHQQPADPVGPFIDGDGMAGGVELRRAGQPRRPRADDRYSFASAHNGGLSNDPALFKSFVDDRAFDALDRDRRFDQAQDAGAFTRRRADAAGKFGKIVGGVEPIQSFAPAVLIDQIIPFRDQIIDGAATLRHCSGMAEGDAAVHAAGALLLKILCR